jgi:hypothetical protein
MKTKTKSNVTKHIKRNKTELEFIKLWTKPQPDGSSPYAQNWLFIELLDVVTRQNELIEHLLAKKNNGGNDET